METKTSKVQSVEMLPEWSNTYGTFYPHKVTFENGDIAIANKAKQNAFTVGQEIQYEIVGQDQAGNNKFKEIQQENSYSGKGKNSNASFALSYSKDWAIAQLNLKKEVTTENILTVATKFNQWLNENS